MPNIWINACKWMGNQMSSRQECALFATGLLLEHSRSTILLETNWRVMRQCLGSPVISHIMGVCILNWSSSMRCKDWEDYCCHLGPGVLVILLMCVPVAQIHWNLRKIGSDTVPRHAIANGFAIGQIPNIIITKDSDGNPVTTTINEEDLTDILCLFLSPTCTFRYVYLE